jgi:hypothetical protein
MANYKEIIVDAITGEKTERPYSAAEIAEVEAALKITLALTKTHEEAEATKAAEKAALLEKLGITETEAKLLLS